ncbi:uncharacterized protein BYT42DRAFT_362318 [Radiomyces spectabilis]|uniref:uncharacterized protein n=1 Tax=Radiomyces spectabilis TaxID=64574 RepID=UPI00221FE6D7|nr:uncharacterized protein BYT42DRAFT_362318 [Radiomyces spectabilis]KAI8377936.1 hypothetical protein BYT42DRAFT_362318 [Radiomyces spectabilis]
MTVVPFYHASDRRITPAERCIWIASSLYTYYKLCRTNIPTLNSLILSEWMALIFTSLVAYRFISRRKEKKSKTDPQQRCDDERSSSATASSDDQHSQDTVYQYKPLSPEPWKTHGMVTEKLAAIHWSKLPPPAHRIFGASRSAFRDGADDGLLCGVLLMPIVAAAQVLDTARRDMDPWHIEHMQAKLELMLLLSFIALLLASIGQLLHSKRRTVRKRGLLLCSVCISTVVVWFITRVTSLVPVLCNTPMTMTVVSLTVFQWCLYLCVVALKKCFSLGEMFLISQGAAVLVHNAMEFIYITFMPEDTPKYIQYADISPIAVLLHAVILGMFIIGILAYPLLRYSRQLARQPYWRTAPVVEGLSSIEKKKILVALAVYGTTLGIILFFIAPVCTSIMGHNPLMWTVEYVFMSPPRLFLCLYWAFTIATTVVVWVLVLDFSSFDTQSVGPPFDAKETQIRVLTQTLNKKRKLFHALAVVMFVPAVLFERSFLQLSFAVALSAFIYLEYLRYFAVWPYGKSLHIFLTEFIDNRDLGPVILSHIYLLLGCASPVWLGRSNLLASLSGILALGFGDAATVEGTLAFILTVYISSIMITYVSAFFGVEDASRFVASAGRSKWFNYMFIVTITGLLEAFSTQNDNIVIPLYMYALIVLEQIV